MSALAPRLLDRYILRQIWVPALLAALVISTVMIASSIQEQIKLLLLDIPYLPLTFSDIGLLSVYALPASAGFVIPITFLIGILLTLGRMAGQFEIVALQASGVSLKRIAVPVILAGAMLSGLCFFVEDAARPWAFQRLLRMVGSDLPLRLTLDMLPPGVMHSFGDWRVYIGERDADHTLRNITVLRPNEQGGMEAFYAARARVAREGEASYLELEEGYMIPDDINRKLSFASVRYRIPSLAEREVPGAIQAIGLAQLIAMEKETGARFAASGTIPDARQARRLRLEISDRLSFPLMCLAVAFVAGPLGARASRSGRSYLFAMGLLIAGGYLMLRRSLEIPFDPFNLPPLSVFIAVGQAPNLILAVAGVTILWRLDRV